mmetsp:Transcript_30371/g.55075  ORF Transcript_30371/g.55075 Transcript_30371/m.55075 type:complete len:218 (-) Transcript_30371:82-735(-)
MSDLQGCCLHLAHRCLGTQRCNCVLRWVLLTLAQISELLFHPVSAVAAQSCVQLQGHRRPSPFHHRSGCRPLMPPSCESGPYPAQSQRAQFAGHPMALATVVRFASPYLGAMFSYQCSQTRENQISLRADGPLGMQMPAVSDPGYWQPKPNLWSGRHAVPPCVRPRSTMAATALIATVPCHCRSRPPSIWAVARCAFPSKTPGCETCPSGRVDDCGR